MSIDQGQPTDLDPEAARLHPTTAPRTPDQLPSDPGASRRGFLRKAGLGGALLTVAGAASPLAGTASAATARRAAPADSGGLDDDGLTAFAMSVEYTGAQLYRAAASKSGLDANVVTLLGTFGDHHQQHGDTFAKSVTAADSFKVPNRKLLDALTPALDKATSQSAVLTALLAFETKVAATYQSFTSTLTDRTDAKGFAAVLLVEAQHAIRLASLLKLSLDTMVPDSEPETGGFDPTAYPGPDLTTPTTAPA